jgi:hypothetical protein
MKTTMTKVFFNQLHPFLQVRRFVNFNIQHILTDVLFNDDLGKNLTGSAVSHIRRDEKEEIRRDQEEHILERIRRDQEEHILERIRRDQGERPSERIRRDQGERPSERIRRDQEDQIVPETREGRLGEDFFYIIYPERPGEIAPKIGQQTDFMAPTSRPNAESERNDRQGSCQAFVISLATRIGLPISRVINWVNAKITLLKTPKSLFLSKWWGQGSLHKSPIDGNWYWDLDDIRAKNRDFERWERQREINKILERTDILRRKRIEKYRRERYGPPLKSTPETEQRYRELVEERIARNRPFSETVLRYLVEKSSDLVAGFTRIYEIFSGQFLVIFGIISSFFWQCYNVVEGTVFLIVFLFHLLLFAILYVPCFQVPLVLFFLNTIRIVAKYSLNPWAYRALVALFFFVLVFGFVEMLFHNPAVVEPFLGYVRETFLEKDFSGKNNLIFYPSIVSLIAGEFSLENLVSYPVINDCNGYINSASPNWYFSLKQISSILIPALLSCFLFRLPLASDLAGNKGRNRLAYTIICYPILFLCLQTTLNSLPVGAYIRSLPETIFNPFLLHFIFLLVTALLIVGSRFFEKAQLYVWVLVPCMYLVFFVFSVDMLFVTGTPPGLYECWSAPYADDLPFQVIFTKPENTFELYWGSFIVLSAIVLLLTLTFVNSIFPYNPIDQALRTHPYPTFSSKGEDVWADFTRNATIFWLFIFTVFLIFLFFSLDNFWIQACQWNWVDTDTASKKHFISVFGKSDSIPEHTLRVQILTSLHQWSSNSITLPSLLNFSFLTTLNQQIAGVIFLGFCFALLEKHILYVFKKRLFPFYTIFVYAFCSFFFIFIPVLFGMILFFSH